MGIRRDLKSRFWPILTGTAFLGEGALPQLVKFVDGRQVESNTTVNALFAEYNLNYHLLLEVGMRCDLKTRFWPILTGTTFWGGWGPPPIGEVCGWQTSLV